MSCPTSHQAVVSGKSLDWGRFRPCSPPWHRICIRKRTNGLFPLLKWTFERNSKTFFPLHNHHSKANWFQMELIFLYQNGQTWFVCELLKKNWGKCVLIFLQLDQAVYFLVHTQKAHTRKQLYSRLTGQSQVLSLVSSSQIWKGKNIKQFSQ